MVVARPMNGLCGGLTLAPGKRGVFSFCYPESDKGHTSALFGLQSLLTYKRILQKNKANGGYGRT